MVHYFILFFWGGGHHFSSNEQFSLIFVDGNTFHVPSMVHQHHLLQAANLKCSLTTEKY